MLKFVAIFVIMLYGIYTFLFMGSVVKYLGSIAKSLNAMLGLTVLTNHDITKHDAGSLEKTIEDNVRKIKEAMEGKNK